jgi:hypothetical protein
VNSDDEIVAIKTVAIERPVAKRIRPSPFDNVKLLTAPSASAPGRMCGTD